MKFTPLELEGAFVIEPDIFSDERGWFFRFYCAEEFEVIPGHKPWVQLNHSFTRQQGTIRGMHFQQPPYSEIKMVKCISGKILDVIVDLRSGSPTFLHSAEVEISADNKRMMYIPEGFAHGFQALTDDCELIYHHSAIYTKGYEGGIGWNDPMLNIQWPLPPVHISARDQTHPLLTSSFSGIKL